MLRRLGFDVLTASDGQQALDVFDQHSKDIDLVLLDMTMPRLSGDQVFAELRKHKPDLPVLLASGYSQQEAHDRFDQDDLAGFIQKPYRFDQLRGLIRDILVD